MKRTPLKRKTPLKPGRPPARSRAKKTRPRPSPNEFPEATRMTVRRRSGGRCEAQSRFCVGVASHFHHRKLRRHRDQRPANCLHVCAPCHRHIHDDTGKAYLMGWLVHSTLDPAEVPVKRGALA